MSRLSHCRHWIFDMDGTLTNAVHDFAAIGEALGIEPGVPILEAIAAMPEEQATVTSQKLHALEMDIAAHSTAQAGTEDTLKELQRRGFSLGILTRNAEDIAQKTLEASGIERFFTPQAVIGRERCTPKPDPAGVHLHLSQWGANASETVIVGDYVFDLETGRNANITTVHLDINAQYPWPEMTDVKVDRIDLILDML